MPTTRDNPWRGLPGGKLDDESSVLAAATRGWFNSHPKFGTPAVLDAAANVGSTLAWEAGNSLFPLLKAMSNKGFVCIYKDSDIATAHYLKAGTVNADLSITLGSKITFSVGNYPGQHSLSKVTTGKILALCANANSTNISYLNTYTISGQTLTQDFSRAVPTNNTPDPSLCAAALSATRGLLVYSDGVDTFAKGFTIGSGSNTLDSGATTISDGSHVYYAVLSANPNAEIVPLSATVAAIILRNQITGYVEIALLTDNGSGTPPTFGTPVNLRSPIVSSVGDRTVRTAYDPITGYGMVALGSTYGAKLNAFRYREGVLSLDGNVTNRLGAPWGNADIAYGGLFGGKPQFLGVADVNYHKTGGVKKYGLAPVEVEQIDAINYGAPLAVDSNPLHGSNGLAICMLSNNLGVAQIGVGAATELTAFRRT